MYYVLGLVYIPDTCAVYSRAKVLTTENVYFLDRSLGNAHSAMGQHKEAYHYAMRHLEISRDTGDITGQTTAQMNLNELSKTLGYPEANQALTMDAPTSTATTKKIDNAQRRVSMEHMDLIKMTPGIVTSPQGGTLH